jgi:hypothetical protein
LYELFALALSYLRDVKYRPKKRLVEIHCNNNASVVSPHHHLTQHGLS